MLHSADFLGVLLTSFLFILNENDLNWTSVFAFSLLSQTSVAVAVLRTVCFHFGVFNMCQHGYLVLAET